MISIKTIENFFVQHSELYEKKYQILGRADLIKEKFSVIPENCLGYIFGKDNALLKLFCDEVLGGKIVKQADLDDFRC
jgi:hypothetical protein